MKNLEKIPTTIVTGFLGAGKTSLLRSLLTRSSLRLGLLINEFGSVGMDASFLSSDSSCPSCDMIELANGCICCTIADDFVPAMKSLAALDRVPDHVIIETSGLALPEPLVKAFSWHEIRNRFYVHGVIALLDAEALVAEKFSSSDKGGTKDNIMDHDTPLGELFSEQLHHADLVLLNKADTVTAIQLEKMKERIKPLHHENVRIEAVHHAQVDERLIFGQAFAHHAHDHNPDDHEHDHDHDDFSSVSLRGGIFPSQDALEELVRACLSHHDLYRLKGYAAIEGKARRLAVQAVGRRINCYYDRLWGEEKPHSALIAIGDASLNGNDIATTLGFRLCTS